MFFLEFFHFLSVLFLWKLPKLSAVKTVLKNRITPVLALAFLIFKTLFRSVSFCFRFLGFFRRRLFCWRETNGVFAYLSKLSKFPFSCGVGYSVWMFGNVLPVRVCTSWNFPVCAVFPVLLIAFSPDLSAFFRIQI
ncbi:MAG: hypothetical protein LBG58_13355 [Planctomycetaceae bacterium]|jgi:hypothetical protein|nr:hypothetical protein [Planctomycetaceae bacterium]